MKRREIVLAVILTIAAVGQIVLSFVLYNQQGSTVLGIVGWAVLSLSAVFGWWPILTFRRKGGVTQGKSYIRTTVLVDSGPYAIVRHPQYLAGVLVSIALPLIAQHWGVIIPGVVAIALYDIGAIQEEKSSLAKFGEDYRRYMEAVPRMNAILGIIRLVRRKRRG